MKKFTLGELLARMTNITNRFVKAYKTDFTEYDAPQVQKLDADGAAVNYLWFVREHGTYFVDLGDENGAAFLKTIREHYREYREYSVTFDGELWTIKKTAEKGAA